MRQGLLHTSKQLPHLKLAGTRSEAGWRPFVRGREGGPSAGALGAPTACYANRAFHAGSINPPAYFHNAKHLDIF